MRTRSKGPWWSENLRWTSFLGPKSALERDFAAENGLRGTSGASLGEARYLARHALISAKPAAGQFDGTYGTVMGQQAVLTPLSTQTTMQVEIFLGVILGLYDPLWHVEWPTKVHEGSGGVLDGLSAVGGALRGFQRPFSR